MTHEQIDTAVKILAKEIQVNSYDGIYPIPRGGYYGAILLSQCTGLPIILDRSAITSRTLVFDDLIDSGKTLAAFTQDKAVLYIKKDKIQEVTYYGLVLLVDEWLAFPDEGRTTIEDNIVRIFQYIGENPQREGLVDTPSRIARMYKEIFRGYDPEQKPKITTFQNGVDGIVYDNMVIDTGNFYSMCEHHMMPFFGRYWFAYVPHPEGKILGLSKIARVVDYHAAKMQIQERLVSDVVADVTAALGEDYPPLGVALVMEAEHLCKTMRGVKKQGKMVASMLTGIFKTEEDTRQEFMQFVNSQR